MNDTTLLFAALSMGLALNDVQYTPPRPAPRRAPLEPSGRHAARLVEDARTDLDRANERGLGAKRRRRLRRRLERKP